MKYITSIAAALFFTCTLAAPAQSSSFYLVLSSSNSKYNGKTLEACHEGAAIEGLCVSKPLAKASKEYNTYRLNATSPSNPNSGILTFTLVAEGENGKVYDNEGLVLYKAKGSNVAIGLFEPGPKYADVSFSSSNALSISGQSSYICEYDFEGYTYPALCFVAAGAKPNNPTCQSVGVKRVFNK